MTDARTRLHQRTAAMGDPQAAVRVLAARVRADDRALVEPYTCLHCSRRKVQVDLGPCGGCQFEPISNSRQRSCIACDGTGRKAWPWADRLTLAAFSGDPAALTLLNTEIHDSAKHWNPLWLQQKGEAALHNLLALSQWPGASLIAALAAGWAWLPEWERTPEESPDGGGWLLVSDDGSPLTLNRGSVDPRARRALTTATEHIRCGCATSRELWVEASAANTPDNHPLEWSDTNQLRGQVSHVARDIGEARTREVISSALVAWALHGELPCG